MPRRKSLQGVCYYYVIVQDHVRIPCSCGGVVRPSLPRRKSLHSFLLLRDRAGFMYAHNRMLGRQAFILRSVTTHSSFASSCMYSIHTIEALYPLSCHFTCCCVQGGWDLRLRSGYFISFSQFVVSNDLFRKTCDCMR